MKKMKKCKCGVSSSSPYPVNDYWVCRDCHGVKTDTKMCQNFCGGKNEYLMITQVYKTGEKKADYISKRGRKPLGFNLYKDGLFVRYIPNSLKEYYPETLISYYIL